MAMPESVWRQRPDPDPRFESARVVMSQWTGSIGRHAVELQSDSADEHHTLSICRRRPDADLIIDGHVVWTGRGAYDPYVLTGPRESRWEAVFRSSYETLRVYIPQSMISECHAEIFGRPPAEAVKLVSADRLLDPGMRQIAQALKLAYVRTEALSPMFLESLGMALTYRMLRTYCVATPANEPRSALTSQCFKKITDYVEDNISLALSLDELSQLAGLSKMYFISRFKKAIGLSPHAYIVRRRIMRAQDLLVRSDESIMAIALSLGFSSHSHLTTTFTRVVGQSPEEWRRGHQDSFGGSR